MDSPLTIQQQLERIARETARLSYPGGMGRGRKQIVKAGTKQEVEEYFSTEFPLRVLWTDASQVADNYDTWHEQQARKLGRFLKQEQHWGNPENCSVVVGAKLVNTFMHQLMKYKEFRPLWCKLHLPLDSIVFQAFRKIRRTSSAITRIVKRVDSKAAYAISYDDYKFIQDTLWDFICELNSRAGVEFEIKSRIELNYLWL